MTIRTDMTIRKAAALALTGTALAALAAPALADGDAGTMGYAILQIDGNDSAGLYGVDLASGVLTVLGDLGMGGFTGFAASQGM